jgi:hypothetical protein
LWAKPLYKCTGRNRRLSERSPGSITPLYGDSAKTPSEATNFGRHTDARVTGQSGWPLILVTYANGDRDVRDIREPQQRSSQPPRISV